MHHATSI